MIRVERAPTPASLKGPKSVGGLETADAVLAYTNGKECEFKAYKAKDVVAALRAMFHKKCAYCEFNYAAGGPEDVEHFRPKGAVVVGGNMSKPGYYWLAATWTNLLPSCIDCNRKRTKEFADGATGISGKANIFPVANEKARWRSHTAPNKEAPLLLNPCDDDPAKHLEFIANGLVRPVITNGRPSAKAQVSIEVYGLLRGDLVEQRRIKETRVRAALERALKAAEIAEGEANAARRASQDLLAKQLLADARTHLANEEPFLATARTIFREYGLL
jgi:uncharacterized protein (TIGR02646 family)